MPDWAAFVVKSIPPPGAPQVQTGPWRPPGWSQTQPQRVSLAVTIPGLPEATVDTTTTVDGQLVPDESNVPNSETFPGTPDQVTRYYFDAVMRLDHNEEVVATRHPVQAGAAVTDHAYSLPAVVILDIKFSDAQQSFDVTQYTGNTSKSVAAYQTFISIKEQHLLCTLTTKLKTYENMLIENISGLESAATVFGVHFVIRLGEIIAGSVSNNTISARPDQNNDTNEGTKNSEPPSQSVVNQLTDIADPNQWNSNTKPNLVPSN